MNHRVLTYTSLMAGFVAMGCVDIAGFATNFVREQFSLSQSVSSLVPSACYVWFLLFSIPAGAAAGRWSRKTVCMASLILCSAGLCLPLMLKTQLWAHLLAFAILGICTTALFVAFNPLVKDAVGVEDLPKALLFGQGLKSCTSIAVPLLLPLFASTVLGWQGALAVLALVSLSGSMLLKNVDIEEQSSATVSLKGTLCLLKDRKMLSFFICSFLLVATDVAVMSHFPALVHDRTGISLNSSSFLVTVYPFAKTAVAFLGGFLLMKLSPRTLGIAGAVLSLVGLAGIILSHNSTTLTIMLVIFGLGYSNLFSINFSKALNAFPERADEVSALLIMSLCGGTLAIGLVPICILWLAVVYFFAR